ncbi:MAG: 2'-5' RNA ligase family protein [Mycobacterium leprae]
MSRYFFAVTPPSPYKEQIDEVRGRWGHPHHPVEPHITAKAPFAWPDDPEQFLAPVRAACGQVAPFQAQLGPTGRFPNAGVLFLTPEGQGFTTLHLAVLHALAGLVPADSHGHEGEGYHPHLTLAVTRFGIDSEGMAAMARVAEQELTGLPPFRVEALTCYQMAAEEESWQVFCRLPLG